MNSVQRLNKTYVDKLQTNAQGQQPNPADTAKLNNTNKYLSDINVKAEDISKLEEQNLLTVGSMKEDPSDQTKMTSDKVRDCIYNFVAYQANPNDPIAWYYKACDNNSQSPKYSFVECDDTQKQYMSIVLRNATTKPRDMAQLQKTVNKYLSDQKSFDVFKTKFKEISLNSFIQIIDHLEIFDKNSDEFKSFMDGNFEEIKNQLKAMDGQKKLSFDETEDNLANLKQLKREIKSLELEKDKYNSLKNMSEIGIFKDINSAQKDALRKIVGDSSYNGKNDKELKKLYNEIRNGSARKSAESIYNNIVSKIDERAKQVKDIEKKSPIYTTDNKSLMKDMYNNLYIKIKNRVNEDFTDKNVADHGKLVEAKDKAKIEMDNAKSSYNKAIQDKSTVESERQALDLAKTSAKNKRDTAENAKLDAEGKKKLAETSKDDAVSELKNVLIGVNVDYLKCYKLQYVEENVVNGDIFINNKGWIYQRQNNESICVGGLKSSFSPYTNYIKENNELKSWNELTEFLSTGDGGNNSRQYLKNLFNVKKADAQKQLDSLKDIVNAFKYDNAIPQDIIKPKDFDLIDKSILESLDKAIVKYNEAHKDLETKANELVHKEHDFKKASDDFAKCEEDYNIKNQIVLNYEKDIQKFTDAESKFKTEEKAYNDFMQKRHVDQFKKKFECDVTKIQANYINITKRIENIDNKFVDFGDKFGNSNIRKSKMYVDKYGSFIRRMLDKIKPLTVQDDDLNVTVYSFNSDDGGLSGLKLEQKRFDDLKFLYEQLIEYKNDNNSNYAQLVNKSSYNVVCKHIKSAVDLYKNKIEAYDNIRVNLKYQSDVTFIGQPAINNKVHDKIDDIFKDDQGKIGSERDVVIFDQFKKFQSELNQLSNGNNLGGIYDHINKIIEFYEPKVKVKNKLNKELERINSLANDQKVKLDKEKTRIETSNVQDQKNNWNSIINETIVYSNNNATSILSIIKDIAKKTFDELKAIRDVIIKQLDQESKNANVNNIKIAYYTYCLNILETQMLANDSSTVEYVDTGAIKQYIKDEVEYIKKLEFQPVVPQNNII